MPLPEAGPRPDGRFPRWVRRAEIPGGPLPPVPEYRCPVRGEGDVRQWTEQFVDIARGEPAVLGSRLALAWDSEHLHAVFEFVDPDRQASAARPGTHVYQFDTTAELFVAGPRGYYEIGVNSVGVSYQVGWSWVAPLVREGDMGALDRLFRLPNFLYYLPRRGEELGRVGDLDFHLGGLEHVERWTEVAGAPGWTSTLALPWTSLLPLLGGSPHPAPDLEFRVQGMRVNPSRGGSPATSWTWSVQGNEDVHNPERWSVVTLGDVAG